MDFVAPKGGRMTTQEAQEQIFRCVMLKECWTAMNPHGVAQFETIVRREIEGILRQTGERLL